MFTEYGTERATAVCQNCIREEIKWRLNSETFCCRSVQSRLCSRLLSKNVIIKFTKTATFSVVSLNEEHKMWVFGNGGEYLDV
jgi:hypothetical protein